MTRKPLKPCKSKMSIIQMLNHENSDVREGDLIVFMIP